MKLMFPSSSVLVQSLMKCLSEWEPPGCDSCLVSIENLHTCGLHDPYDLRMSKRKIPALFIGTKCDSIKDEEGVFVFFHVILDILLCT